MREQVLFVTSPGLGGPAFGVAGRLVTGAEQLRAEYADALSRRAGSLWVARSASELCALTRDAPNLRATQRLLLLQQAEPSQRSLLHLLFRVVVEPGSGVSLLALDELAEALSAPNREDLFVAGAVSACDRAVLLYRGTLDPVVVPFAWFERRQAAPAPDFTRLDLEDYGQTVRLGEYEASADVILYAFDPAYRRRARARELSADDSFGACVRRLRLLRGLRRTDFEPLSDKEIARIERGEVRRPRRATVAAIAARLGVEPEEIASY